MSGRRGKPFRADIWRLVGKAEPGAVEPTCVHRRRAARCLICSGFDYWLQRPENLQLFYDSVQKRGEYTMRDVHAKYFAELEGNAVWSLPTPKRSVLAYQKTGEA